jgi:hypothetical protein
MLLDPSLSLCGHRNEDVDGGRADDVALLWAQWLVENHPTKPSKAEWAESLVLKLTAGDFFGEIALLSGKPRQATVMTFSPPPPCSRSHHLNYLFPP